MTDHAETFADLGFAKVDTHREARWGLPEAVLGIGKTPEQVVGIVRRLVDHNQGPVLVTKTTRQTYDAVSAEVPAAVWHDAARMIRVMREPSVRAGRVGIIAAGTSDLPVAEEAALTAEAAGATIERVYDVGVAGIHRLLAHTETISKADCLVVIAGMEGALPTVVAGLTARPVVAVPSSVGYGTSMGGIAALLGMLNSCAPQVVCVNVDNGFGAGFFAALVTRRA